MAIYLPVTSFITWLTLRWLNRKYNFAESLIVTIFITSQGLIPQIIAFFIASLVDKSAFTRTADKAAMTLTGVLVIIQFYQIGYSTSSKTRRIIVDLIGTTLLFAWTFAALDIQTWLHK